MSTFTAIEEEISGMLAIPDEELDEEQRAEMDRYLDELAQAESDKVDGVCGWMTAELARAEACKKEGDRLRAKAKTIESRIAWLKHRYAETMLGHGVKKIKGEVYSISTRTTQATDIADESAIPAQYRIEKVVTDIDKRSILADLKAGKEIPGARLVERTSISYR